MSEQEQNKPGLGRVLRCDEWESLLADAMDGALSAADRAAFDRHQKECALCAQMLKETEQGRGWMEYLAVEPEVPAGLLNKILARTSSGAEQGVAAPALSLPTRPAWHRVVLPAVRQMLEPRLLMTAAMAFFSIALTLNLTGIKLSQLRAEDFQPSRLKANLTRQFYSTNAQVTKYYENLRLVYEMESKVRELRRTTETAPAAAPQEAPKPPAGGSSPSSRAPRRQHVPPSGDEPETGSQGGSQGGSRSGAVAPAEMVPAAMDSRGKKGKFQKEVFRTLPSTPEDPGQRSWV
jgi:Putative zinc-finger